MYFLKWENMIGTCVLLCACVCFLFFILLELLLCLNCPEAQGDMVVFVEYRSAILWGRAGWPGEGCLHPGLGQGFQQQPPTSCGWPEHQLLWEPDYCLSGTQWGWEDYHHVCHKDAVYTSIVSHNNHSQSWTCGKHVKQISAADFSVRSTMSHSF